MMMKSMIAREFEKLIKWYRHKFDTFTWIWLDILYPLTIACDKEVSIRHNIARTIESKPRNNFVTHISRLFEEFTYSTHLWVFLWEIKRPSWKWEELTSSWLWLFGNEYPFIRKYRDHKCSVQEPNPLKSTKWSIIHSLIPLKYFTSHTSEDAFCIFWDVVMRGEHDFLLEIISMEKQLLQCHSHIEWFSFFTDKKVRNLEIHILRERTCIIIWGSDSSQEFSHLIWEKWKEHECYIPQI